jgi:thioredoxin-related protein
LYTKYLHRILNIAIILASVLLLSALAQHYYQTKRVTNRTISVNGVDFSRSKRTLLLFFQLDCDICKESSPFYRSLVDTFRETEKVQFVFITPEKPAVAEQFFRGAGISSKTFHQGKAGMLGVTSTPTLILADSAGKVQGFWVGRLSAEREAEIRNLLVN